MINVLIAKSNKEFIEQLNICTIKFRSSTKNTCTFKISESDFMNLYNKIKASGLNPFALMSW